MRVFKRGCHVLDSLALFKKVISVKEDDRILESYTNPQLLIWFAKLYQILQPPSTGLPTS